MKAAKPLQLQPEQRQNRSVAEYRIDWWMSASNDVCNLSENCQIPSVVMNVCLSDGQALCACVRGRWVGLLQVQAQRRFPCSSRAGHRHHPPEEDGEEDGSCAH